MISVIRENRTLKEMILGIVVSGALVALACAFLSKNVLTDIIGLLLGIAGAVFMVIHMAVTIEDAVLLGEKGAIAYTRKMTYIRYAVVCVIVIVVGITKIGSPVMCVIGVMLLKAGAYLQPLAHRILCSKDKSNHEDVRDEISDTENNQGGE